ATRSRRGLDGAGGGRRRIEHAVVLRNNGCAPRTAHHAEDRAEQRRADCPQCLYSGDDLRLRGALVSTYEDHAVRGWRHGGRVGYRDDGRRVDEDEVELTPHLVQDRPHPRVRKELAGV